LEAIRTGALSRRRSPTGPDFGGVDDSKAGLLPWRTALWAWSSPIHREIDRYGRQGFWHDPRRLCQELRRVLRPDGRAVVLVTDGDDRLTDAEEAGLTPIDRRQVSFFGAHPELVILQPR
jgi:SAM-dependent methyltransferase